MRSNLLERWKFALTNLAIGAAVAGVGYVGLGWDAVSVLLIAGVMGVQAWWVSPLRPGRHVGHATAQAEADEGDVIVYWRPGCRYCSQLKRDLGTTSDDVIWVNVLRDAEAVEHVARHRGGDVVVPTVVTGAGRHLPADPETIRAHVAEHPAA